MDIPGGRQLCPGLEKFRWIPERGVKFRLVTAPNQWIVS